MADSLRAFRYALKTTRGVPAPEAAYKAVPVENYEHDTAGRGREVVSYLRNTANRADHVIGKGEFDTFKITSEAVYDWQLDFWSAFLGLPTTSPHSGASGAFDHVHIENDADLYMDIRFLTSEGWWEMPDCVVDSVAPKQAGETRLMLEWELKGAPARPLSVQKVELTGGPTGGAWVLTVPAFGDEPAQSVTGISPTVTASSLQAALEAKSRIGVGNVLVTRTGAGSAGSPYLYLILLKQKLSPIGTFTSTNTLTGGTTPSVTITPNSYSAFAANFPLAEAVADYDPMEWVHFAAKINGAAADLKSWDLTLARGREPEYGGRRTTDPAFWTKPDIKITGNFMPLYKLTGDAGSAFENFRNRQTPISIEFEYVSVHDTIGAGSGTNPLFSILVEKVLPTKGGHDVQAMPTETPIGFTSGYKGGAGRSIRVLHTNEVTSVVAA